MGRSRTTKEVLPKWMYKRRASYYFRPPEPPRKWIPLGANFASALAVYARLIASSKESIKESALDRFELPVNPTFSDAVRQYRSYVLPNKAPRSIRDNESQLLFLEPVFGAVRLADITPQHVRRYLDERGKSSRTQANRERALLSHVINSARERGLMTGANPSEGVKSFPEKSRTVYVTDDELRALKTHSPPDLIDAIDLAVTLGVRPGDVLAIRTIDISKNELLVRPSKTQRSTGTVLRFSITPALRLLLDRIVERPYRSKLSDQLLQTNSGDPMTHNSLRNRFDAARKATGTTFQFRDLRAKNASDSSSLEVAKLRLGHASVTMTERYVRQRIGQKVMPLDPKTEGSKL